MPAVFWDRGRILTLPILRGFSAAIAELFSASAFHT